MKIEIQNINFTYRSILTPPHRALSNISLDIEAGERLAIVGSSGSGKSTLVQHLNGLNKPDSGKILFDGEDVFATSGGALFLLKRRVGLVFQFPEVQLFEETVFQDVAFGPKNLGLSEKEIEQHVHSALNSVGMNDSVIFDRSPFELSGGERRRVALAGVLAMNPEVLVLDEPTVGLDRRSSEQVEQIIESFDHARKTVIFVSHNMDFVAKLAKRIVVMHKGSILFDGGKKQLFENDSILKKAGLQMPRLPVCMKRLGSLGLDVRSDIYSIEEAREEIMKARDGI